jgi:hypothetical protein
MPVVKIVVWQEKKTPGLVTSKITPTIGRKAKRKRILRTISKTYFRI